MGTANYFQMQLLLIQFRKILTQILHSICSDMIYLGLRFDKVNNGDMPLKCVPRSFVSDWKGLLHHTHIKSVQGSLPKLEDQKSQNRRQYFTNYMVTYPTFAKIILHLQFLYKYTLFLLRKLQIEINFNCYLKK